MSWKYPRDLRHKPDPPRPRLADAEPDRRRPVIISWGLLAMTAADPAGPWSDPVMVLGIEGDAYYPAHGGIVPGVRPRRLCLRAEHVAGGQSQLPGDLPRGDRVGPSARRLAARSARYGVARRVRGTGSDWASGARPTRDSSIGRGSSRCSFASRETASGLGTINFASRPWDHPSARARFRRQRPGGREPRAAAVCVEGFSTAGRPTLRGRPGRIVWGYQAPLGPDRHSCDATLHALTRTRHQGLEISSQAWRLLTVDAAGKIAADRRRSARSRSVAASCRLAPRRQQHGIVDRRQAALARAECPSPPDRSGFSSSRTAIWPWSDLPSPVPGSRPRSPIWPRKPSPGRACPSKIGTRRLATDYRFGVGAVRKTPGGRVKWNFRGRGFRLWSPKGPDFGRCDLLIDGRRMAELDMHSDRASRRRWFFPPRTSAMDIMPWCFDRGPGGSSSIRWRRSNDDNGPPGFRLRQVI